MRFFIQSLMCLKSSLIKSFVIALVMCCLTMSLKAQKIQTRSLSWKYNQSAKVTLSKEKISLWFDGALSSGEADLPLYFERFPLPQGSANVSAEIVDAAYEALTKTENDYLISKNYNPLVAKLNARVVYDRKKPYAAVTLDPFRLNSATGLFEKLISFSLKLTPVFGTSPKQKSWSFADNSILASGTWIKMTITSTGIYKITYDDLETMGVPVSSIDRNNIRIFGNGGKMLPENNSVFRYDDLQENAIYVSGSGSQFTSQDYILFYAVGPVSWVYDTLKNRYTHSLNKYAGSAAYFLTYDLGPGKRITTEPSETQSPDYYANTFNDYRYHEIDSLNLIKSGREWYGEVFDITTSYSWTYDLPGIVTGSPVRLRTSLLARSFASSSFDVYLNGTKVKTELVNAVPTQYTGVYANVVEDTTSAIISSPVTVMIAYNKGASSSAVGWLNHFEINVTRSLNYYGGQMPFRNAASVKKGVTEFSLGNATGVTVWDVTDPLNVKSVAGTYAGSSFVYRLRTDTLMEFLAYDGNSYYSISNFEEIANQNLHHFLNPVDMIIITHPNFEGAANLLADMHRSQDGYNVIVVRPDWVYNEFSSGIQDPTAIRSFMKMFYDRAGGDPDKMPEYLLLVGDGSYDNLNRLPDNTNFIVTWQTTNSLAPTSSFATDDYFAFLDDSESGGYDGSLDISVGRLPVKTAAEANALAAKIIRYTATTDLNAQGSSCSGFTSGISNLADWRNILCFIADDADLAGEAFLSESETIANKVDTMDDNYNIDKIYFDAYVEESTPGGQRYPDVNDAINKRVEKGALIINYIGHGGELGWAHEAVLGISDINSWDNRFNMPFFVTATCEFSRFDDPARTSAGEYVLINSEGGGIGLFTTTRLAFSGSNHELNSLFYDYVFRKTDGKYPCIGDVVRNSKNAYGCASVIANFCLLGDPAMKLAYPKYKVVTTGINNHPLNPGLDTVHAMSKVTIAGEITDENDIKLTDYNGILYPTVFDKRMLITSLGNDAGYPQNFYIQKNIIYKGKASITGGNFAFTFYVPKDISYVFGKGRLSYYAQNGVSDANGNYEDFIIGGSETAPITDKEGPEVDMFLNDEHFVSGGITDNSPFLLAKLSDSSGLNTVGSGIGHDIAVVLDGNTDKTYVLNDYYEADLNTYQSGVVRYPFKDLAVGPHSMNMKVWDIFNNSSDKSLDFVVAEDAKLALDHVLNYPNPFTTYTEFWFEHNRPCCGLDVQIQIFTISGKLIKTIDTYVQTNGYRAEPIPWDGLDDYGDPIGKGVYLYKLRVKDNQGGYAEKIEKLVILK